MWWSSAERTSWWRERREVDRASLSGVIISETQKINQTLALENMGREHYTVDPKWITSELWPILSDLERLPGAWSLRGHAVERIRSAMERLKGLSSERLDYFLTTQGWLADPLFDADLQSYAPAQKKKIFFERIVRSTLRLTVIPELSLLARAHAPQVSLVTRDMRGAETTLPDAYDDGEFQELFSRLDRIDRLLPDDQSISDFVRERPTFGKGTLETDRGLIRDGMIHLIRTLKPRDGLWLEQMATHGNLTLHSSIPGGTDIVREGVTYNVVRILLEYQKYIRNFQLRQTELRKIRRSTQKWSLREPYIPRESTAFPEIAPTGREAMRELQKQISEARTYEELARLFTGTVISYSGVNELMAGTVGISESGLIMTPTERLMDLAGGVGNIILYTIIGRMIWIGVKGVGLGVEQIAWLQKVVNQYFPKVTRMTDAIRTLRPKASR